MPELPEVETICRDLSKKILRKKIIAINVKTARLVNNGVKTFQNKLISNQFIDINRRGKLIYLTLKSHDFLLVHLKMTGQLIYQEKDHIIAGGHSYASFDFNLPNKYSQVIFKFIDKSELFFNDMRTFGYMQIVTKSDLHNVLSKYGIEPLTKAFSLANFTKALQGRKTNIKAILLNQHIIAGIGNIYADEICFYAHVLPERSAASLTTVEIKKLWQGAQTIIRQAIKYRGTTFNDYRDADGNKGNFSQHLKVFHKNGQQCPRCRKAIIKKIKLAGRGTHFCPHCQY